MRSKPPSIKQILQAKPKAHRTIQGSEPGWALCVICGQGPLMPVGSTEGRRFMLCRQCRSLNVSGPGYRPPKRSPRDVAVAARLNHAADERRHLAHAYHLTKYAHHLRQHHVLDVGTGTGHFLGVLEQWFKCHGAGFEIDRALIQYGAKQRRAIFQGDFLTMSVPARAFTLVTFWNALEYFALPWAALHKAWDSLAPGGAVMIGIPNGASWGARANGLRWAGYRRHPGAQFLPSRQGLRRAMEVAGFVDIQVSTYSQRCLDHPDGYCLQAMLEFGEAVPAYSAGAKLAKEAFEDFVALWGWGQMILAAGRRSPDEDGPRPRGHIPPATREPLPEDLPLSPEPDITPASKAEPASADTPS